MTFGERLKRARKSKGLTQVDVAHFFDIDPTTVSKWESNSSEPNKETLIKLAELYGTEVQYLLDGEHVHFFDPALESALKNASEDQRIKVLDYLEGRTKSPVNYDANEERIIYGAQTLTVDELISNYEIQINGQKATEDEIREAIEYLKARRVMRMMNND